MRADASSVFIGGIMSKFHGRILEKYDIDHSDTYFPTNLPLQTAAKGLYRAWYFIIKIYYIIIKK